MLALASFTITPKSTFASTVLDVEGAVGSSLGSGWIVDDNATATSLAPGTGYIDSCVHNTTTNEASFDSVIFQNHSSTVGYAVSTHTWPVHVSGQYCFSDTLIVYDDGLTASTSYRTYMGFAFGGNNASLSMLSGDYIHVTSDGFHVPSPFYTKIANMGSITPTLYSGPSTSVP